MSASSLLDSIVTLPEKGFGGEQWKTRLNPDSLSLEGLMNLSAILSCQRMNEWMNEWLYSQWVSLKICLFNSFGPLAEIFFFVEGFKVYIFGGNQFKWYCPEPETTSDVFGVTCPLPEISGCWRKCTCQLSILKQCLWQLGEFCPLPFCLFILLFHFGKQVPETYNEQTGNAFLFCSESLTAHIITQAVVEVGSQGWNGLCYLQLVNAFKW